MSNMKRLASAEGMIFWTFACVVISYFLTISYHTQVFRSLIADNPSLNTLAYQAPVMSDIQSVAALVSGILLTAGLAFQRESTIFIRKILKFIPFVLFLIPGISSFAYFRCRYGIGGACTVDAGFEAIYFGSLLFLSLIIGQILIRSVIPDKILRLALIPLIVVVLGSIFSMVFSLYFGSTALQLTDLAAENLFVLGNFSKLPGEWRIWVQTGIALQILFTLLSVVGLFLAVMAIFVKPRDLIQKKKR